MATKKCLFCAEEIQAESIKCPLCGENPGKRLWKKSWMDKFDRKVKLIWKNSLIALYFKRKALEEQKKIESLDAEEAQHNKSGNWIALYFKRKRLEEQQKIDALNKKSEQK